MSAKLAGRGQMKVITRMLAFACVSTLPFITSGRLDAAEGTAPTVSVDYKVPGHPRYQRLYDAAVNTDYPRGMIEALLVELPPTEPIRAELRDCGVESISYLRAERTIRICYEALAAFGDAAPTQNRSVLAGMTVSAVTYAITRAVLDVYSSSSVFPPPSSTDVDARDELFVVLMAGRERFPQTARDVARWMDSAASIWQLGTSKALKGALDISKESRDTFTCLVVGSDPSAFEDIATARKMTPARIEQCRQSWATASEKLAPMQQAMAQRLIEQEPRCIGHSRDGQLDQAVGCFTRLIEPSLAAAPTGERLARLLALRAGVLARSAGTVERARNDIERATKINAKEPAIYRAECNLLEQSKDWRGLETAATRALANFPNDDELKISRAKAKLSLGDRTGAATDLSGVRFPSPWIRNVFVAFGIVAAPGIATPLAVVTPTRLAGSQSTGSTVAEPADNIVIESIGSADSFATEAPSLVGQSCKVGRTPLQYNMIGSYYGPVLCGGAVRYLGDFKFRFIDQPPGPSPESTVRDGGASTH